jgi:hypothetical protein
MVHDTHARHYCGTVKRYSKYRKYGVLPVASSKYNTSSQRYEI